MPSPFRTIRWKLISGSLLAIGAPLVIFTFFLTTVLWNFYLDQMQTELRSKALVIADDSGSILSPTTPDDPRGLAAIVRRWRRYSSMRITLVDNEERIAASTLGTDVGARLTEQRYPGLRAALRGAANSTVWKSPNFGYEDTMYVNIPIREAGLPVGAVRVAYTLTQIQEKLRHVQALLLGGFLIYGALIVALTVLLARHIVRPVEALNQSAQALAAGDLSHRVHVKGSAEVNQLGTTLNRMSERLQQLEGLRRQYVSNVSHELRTPLASIRGMAETLLTYGPSDPELPGRYLPRIIAQTDRLARLASQLLDLAQIESGNLVAGRDPVALAAVVQEAFHTCAASAAEKQVELCADLPTDLPEVRADHDRLVQVALNLVDNALRYTPAGGQVTVRARVDGDWITVTVADTGAGIPAEHLPHLFDRFYRVDAARSRNAGGTGLGLSIVQQIVRAHGGAIRVESEVGAGTQFIIRLPAQPSVVSKKEAACPQPS